MFVFRNPSGVSLATTCPSEVKTAVVIFPNPISRLSQSIPPRESVCQILLPLVALCRFLVKERKRQRQQGGYRKRYQKRQDREFKIAQCNRMQTPKHRNCNNVKKTRRETDKQCRTKHVATRFPNNRLVACRQFRNCHNLVFPKQTPYRAGKHRLWVSHLPVLQDGQDLGPELLLRFLHNM